MVGHRVKKLELFEIESMTSGTYMGNFQPCSLYHSRVIWCNSQNLYMMEHVWSL